MSQQVRANTTLLAAGTNIGVSDEGHVAHRLDAHYANQFAILGIAPEHNALIDFMTQFLPGHVRLCEAIRRYDPSISLRTVVDDAPSRFEVVVVAAADH